MSRGAELGQVQSPDPAFSGEPASVFFGLVGLASRKSVSGRSADAVSTLTTSSPVLPGTKANRQRRQCARVIAAIGMVAGSPCRPAVCVAFAVMETTAGRRQSPQLLEAQNPKCLVPMSNMPDAGPPH